MKTTIDGMEVEGTPEEIMSLLKHLKKKEVTEGQVSTPKATLLVVSAPPKDKDDEAEDLKFAGAHYRGQLWNMEESRIIKRYYAKYMVHDRISKKGLGVLCRILKHRSQISIQKQASKIGATSGYMKGTNRLQGYHDRLKAAKGRDHTYMLKNKAMLPPQVDGRTIQMRETDRPFPGIYPLAPGAEIIFKDVILDALGRKGVVGLDDITACCQLRDGKTWSISLWCEFCTQVMYNIPAICKALAIDQKSIRVTKKNGKVVIVCY